MVRVEFVDPHAQPPGNLVLVDSGADCTFLPLTWLRFFGLTMDDDCERVQLGAADGDGEGYHYAPGLQVRIEDIDLTLEVIFSETEIPMLGRRDFFETFRVTMDQRRGMLTLEPYADAFASSAPSAGDPEPQAPDDPTPPA
jgi:hypothetical protein